MSFSAKSQGRNSNLWVHRLLRYQHSASMAHFGTKSLAWGVRCSASNVIKPCAWYQLGMVKLHMLGKYWCTKHIYMFEDGAHKQTHTTKKHTHTHTHRHTEQHNRTQHNRTELNTKCKQHTLMTLLATYKRRHTMNLFHPICKCCTTKNGKESKNFQLLLATYGQITATMVSTCQYHVCSQCPITFPSMARRLKDMDLFGILELATKSYPWTTGFLVRFLTEAGGKIPKLLHVQHMLLSTIWCWISKDLLDD